MTSDELLFWGFLQGAWWVALFVACGVTAGEVASSKGNGGVAATLLGLVFGPIGLLIAYASPSNAGELERRLILRGERNRCPACAEIVRVEATKCRHCGDPLPATSQQASAHVSLATVSNWPSAAKLPALTRKEAVAIAAAIAAVIVLVGTIAAYKAGYRFVTPSVWWQSIHR